MGRSSKKLFNSIYENDVLDLDTLEELEQVGPLKSNKAVKKAARKAPPSPGTSSKSTIVSTNPVDATCNKCDAKIVGDLIGDIYIPIIEKIVPLISYTCKGCGHIGRRSVMTLALPLDQYERKYFN
jgi:hypothetical protein